MPQKSISYGLLAKVLGNDLIALEVKYHKNCLAEIITKTKRRESRPSNEESETSVFDEAFDKLISEIEADFFQGATFSTSFLLSRYKNSPLPYSVWAIFKTLQYGG